MRHMRAVNQKARRVETIHAESAASPTPAPPTAAPDASANGEADVVALQQAGPPAPTGPHIPMGCSFVFSPGWEADSTGGTAGLCQPVERDLFDCHITCFWPAHVPDLYNHAPDWMATCAAAQKDWRKIDLIFP